ncbi:MAG: dihydroneopterin aldolase [Flavobacteriales bacterium]|nr:dihydroneopterin aldolase [Flavobacteriales bacterium]
MGLIEVKDIRVFAYHGCLEEEARIGGHYRIDITVSGDLVRAENSDDLTDTVDYGRITSIVKEQMAIRSKLIEHVARRIHTALKEQWSQPLNWRVRVVKERPPVQGDVAEVTYTVEG